MYIERQQFFPDVLHDYDLRAFRKWENKLTSNDYHRLPKENEKELMHVAERMHKRFPLILSKEYKSEIYKASFPRNNIILQIHYLRHTFKFNLT